MRKRKGPVARVIFFARIVPTSERLRLKLRRKLGGVSNSKLAERAFEALAAQLEESSEASTAA